MQTSEFLFFLMVVVSLGIWTVAEERRALRLGTEIGRLKQQKGELREERQELRFRRASGSAPERLEQAAREFALGLLPPGRREAAIEPPRSRPAPAPLRLLARHTTGAER